MRIIYQDKIRSLTMSAIILSSSTFSSFSCTDFLDAECLRDNKENYYNLYEVPLNDSEVSVNNNKVMTDDSESLKNICEYKEYHELITVKEQGEPSPCFVEENLSDYHTNRLISNTIIEQTTLEFSFTLNHSGISILMKMINAQLKPNLKPNPLVEDAASSFYKHNIKDDWINISNDDVQKEKYH